MALYFILFIIFFLIVRTMIKRSAGQAQARLRAEFDALAAIAQSRQWRIGEEFERRRRVITVAPEDGAWTLRLVGSAPRHRRHRHTDPRDPGHSQFHSLRSTRDTMVIVLPSMPDLPDLVRGSGLTGLVRSNNVWIKLADTLPADVVRDIGRLHPCPAPDGLSLSLLTDTEPKDADLTGIDLAAIARLLWNWDPAHRPGPRQSFGRPTVILGPEGLRFRLPLRLRTAEEIVRFIDDGQRLAASPPP